MAAHLSKSRFLMGLQCHRQLWWAVHEPDAAELVPDERTAAMFDRGHRVGDVARTYIPGGVLIDLPHRELTGRVEATRRALAEGAPVIYEASFLEDGVFVAADILERTSDGWGLIEVKSTLDVKEKHLPDVAVQLHVLRRAGLNVRRAELMHLNRACVYPDLSKLFSREDVTKEAEALLATVTREVPVQLRVLDGSLPEVPIGPHCWQPYDCPFGSRCWPAPTEQNLENLYGYGATRAMALRERGFKTILDLPEDFGLFVESRADGIMQHGVKGRGGRGRGSGRRRARNGWGWQS